MKVVRWIVGALHDLWDMIVCPAALYERHERCEQETLD